MAAFFDTNVLVYCTDVAAPAKQARARALVGRCAAAGEAVVSTQVLAELFHTLTRKQRMPPEAAQALMQACRRGRCSAATSRSSAQPSTDPSAIGYRSGMP